MINLGVVKPCSTIYIPFDTFDGGTGASLTMTGLAVGDILVYKDGGMTQRASTSGFTLLDTDGIDIDLLTGIHGVSINLADDTTAGFWAAGSKYFVVISTITVDAQTVSFVAATFDIGVPGATLDTTIATLASQTSFTLTNGPAEDDALNGCVCYIHDVASAVQGGFAVVSDYTGSTKTVTLTAGTTFTAAATDNISIFPPANTRWLGGTLQTGNDVGVDINDILTDTADMQPKLGTPAGASLAADILVIDNFVDGLETTIGAAGAGLTAIPWNAAWDAEVESEVDDALGAGTGTSLTAIPWNAAWDAEVESEVDDALGAGTGTALTAIPWNAAWDAEVQSEVDDALIAQRLDELINADSDIDGLAPPTVGSVVHELLTKTAGSFTYDQTTDSLEAIRDKETDIETDTAEIGVAGAGLTNINLPDQTMAITGDITGNLSGSVGSVTGAVGSVTGAVGSVTGAVGSVTGAVGSVTGLTAATVHSDLDDIQSRLPAALIGGRMDSDVEAINNSTVAADVLAILNGATVVYQGTVTGAATTTTLIDSGLTQASTDWWKGRIIIFTSVVTLQATDITAFDPALDKLTFTALTAAPTGATYVII